MSSATAQWLKTVDEKRKLRDDAVSSFLDGQSGSEEVFGHTAVRLSACSQIPVNATKRAWQLQKWHRIPHSHRRCRDDSASDFF
jgi:hypothetical protein